jgi:hypothetical protein
MALRLGSEQGMPHWEIRAATSPTGLTGRDGRRCRSCNRPTTGTPKGPTRLICSTPVVFWTN